MKQTQEEINILFAEIDRLKHDIGNKNSFEETIKNYANIEYIQEKLGLEMTVLGDYAFFLRKQNNPIAAIEKYTRELVRCKELAEYNPTSYLPCVAETLSNLAILQSDTNHYKEAEANFSVSLTIRRELAKDNPDAYLPDVAATLNNLAIVRSETNCDTTEAESNYYEAINIYRILSRTNRSMYLPELARTLNNLANLLSYITLWNEALDIYAGVLPIYRELAETNPDKYLPYVAQTLCNMADIHEDTNCYIEALAIYRELAKTNPDAYLSSIAWTLGEFSKTANIQLNRNQLAKAEANYTEVLTICRELAKSNPDIYLSTAVMSLENIILIKERLSKFEEAEELKKELSRIEENNH